MNKITLVIFAALSFAFSAKANAGNGEGSDMFRTIEKFENDTIKSDKYRRNPIRYTGEQRTGCGRASPYERPCAKAAKQYEDPVRHGEPIVSEDDY